MDFNSDGSETESFLQMSSSQAWLHRRLSMHTARDKIKHSRLLSALKRPGPWSMWSPYLFIYFSPRLTSNDKDSNKGRKRGAHIQEVIKCRSDFAGKEMWRFSATPVLNKKLLESFCIASIVGKVKDCAFLMSFFFFNRPGKWVPLYLNYSLVIPGRSYCCKTAVRTCGVASFLKHAGFSIFIRLLTYMKAPSCPCQHVEDI